MAGAVGKRSSISLDEGDSLDWTAASVDWPSLTASKEGGLEDVVSGIEVRLEINKLMK